MFFSLQKPILAALFIVWALSLIGMLISIPRNRPNLAYAYVFQCTMWVVGGLVGLVLCYKDRTSLLSLEEPLLNLP